eukprot:1360744-Amorphochlora_amoeboformis.AAC.1
MVRESDIPRLERFQNRARNIVVREISMQDLSAELKTLYISAVKEVILKDKRSALCIFVPFNMHSRFKTIQRWIFT